MLYSVIRPNDVAVERRDKRIGLDNIFRLGQNIPIHSLAHTRSRRTEEVEKVVGSVAKILSIILINIANFILIVLWG